MSRVNINEYVEEIRKAKHQRGSACGRRVKIPRKCIDNLAQSNEYINCTVICWVEPDHYLIALPMSFTKDTARVHCGVCVDIG